MTTERPKIQRWLSIESNPNVMNKFLNKCGVPTDKWAISDVYGLKEEHLETLPQPVLSLILLFPISEKYEKDCRKQENLGGSNRDVPSNLYFMKQSIRNAAGSVAIIHAIANNLDLIPLEEGSSVNKFLQETANNTPEERAVALESDDNISTAHNQVAQLGQTSTPNLEDKVDYHYVAFVEYGGHLFELDGRKSSAINLGPTTKDDFLSDAAKECQWYMKRDPENLKFAVIALAPTNAN